MAEWQTLEQLVAKVETLDAEHRSRIAAEGMVIGAMCARAAAKAHTDDFVIEEYADSLEVYGYLGVDESGLFLATRTTEDDFHEAHFGPDYPRGYTVCRPDDWPVNWLRFVVDTQKLDELKACLQKALQAQLERSTHAPRAGAHEQWMPSPPVVRVAEAVGLSSTVQTWRRLERERLIDPQASLASAATLLESTCKGILRARGVNTDQVRGVLAAFKQTSKSLTQRTQEVPAGLTTLLSGLSSIAHGVAELRNAHSTAHDRGEGHGDVPDHIVELAVFASGMASVFLMRHHEAAKIG